MPLVILAAAWELAPRAGLTDPSVLPPLSRISAAGLELLLDGTLWSNGVSSFGNWFIGLMIALVVGIGLGIAMGRYSIVDDFVGPLVKALYPMPKSALIPVMILWFGLGSGSKIASIALTCLLPVIMSAYNGARGVDQMLLWSARALGASERSILWDVVLPSAMPLIMAGVRNAIALSFIALVASEFLIAQRGLGYLISFLGDAGAYDAMFAVVIVVSALGFAADRAYLWFMRRALAWRE